MVVAFVLCLVCASVVWSATTFSGQLVVTPSWKHTKTGLTTINESFSRILQWSHTSGTSTNQMNQLFRETVILTNGQGRTVNLATGVTNAFGDSVTFDEVRVICVECPSTNLNNVTVGNAADNEFDSWLGGTNHTVTVRPGGLMLLVAPDATAYDSSTNGKLKILNASTNTVSYDLWIGGSDS